MHRLALILESADASRLQELNSTAIGVQAGLEKIRGAFSSLLPKLGAVVLISKWHHIDNALQVPFIPAKQRVQLLTNLRTISASLNQKFENLTTPPAPVNSAAQAQECAQRQGRIALALLGSAWVNDPQAHDKSGGAVKLKFEDLKERVNHPKPNWWESLDEAGEQIGWHWRELARRVDALTDKANRDTLAAARPMLARANYLARLAGSAAELGKDRDPITDYRRYRLHQFLLNQARRNIDANWAAAELAAEQSGKPSYAAETASQFVNDAEHLIMLGADKNPTPEDRDRLLAEVNPMRKALKIQGYAVEPDSKRIELIDEQNFRVKFKFTAPSGQPAGYPVRRINVSGSCKLPSEMTSRRIPITDLVENLSPNAILTVEASANGPGQIILELWHRGHRYPTSVLVK